MKQLWLSLVLLALSYVVDAQKAFINKDYKGVNKKELKIFIVPYFSPGAKHYNDLFFNAFNKGQFSIVDTAQAAYNILNLKEFNNSLRMVTNIRYEAAYFKKHINLYASLPQYAIQDFKENCLNADIIIMCSNITSRHVLNTNGSQRSTTACNIAIYDLSTGEFIALYSYKVKQKYPKANVNIETPVDELIEGLSRSFLENYK